MHKDIQEFVNGYAENHNGTELVTKPGVWEEASQVWEETQHPVAVERAMIPHLGRAIACELSLHLIRRQARREMGFTTK